jgi:SAM-dependent methyltransferase
MTAADLAEDYMWKAYNDFHYHCDTARMQKIFARHRMFLETVDLPGHIIDAGVFKGSSAILFAHMLKTYCPYARKKVVGFDTFAGAFDAIETFEATRAANFMAKYEPGMEGALRGVLDAQGLADYCELVRGDIVVTLPAYVERNRGMRVSLLHLDLDVFRPTLEVLRICYDIMVPGGIILLDQFGVEGWGETDAVTAFMKERGLRPDIRLVGHTATPTAYIRV